MTQQHRYRLQKSWIVVVVFLFSSQYYAQQQADTNFNLTIENPRYPLNEGPLILIDGLHNNLHQVDGNFAPFAKLARKDGFRVEALVDWKQLQKADILVIANPIHSDNQGNWVRPIHSAFSLEEINKIQGFVYNGGRLLLIADHMPFAGASQELGQAFGIEFCDGFAQLSQKENGRDVFSQTNGRLNECALTDGTLGDSIQKLYSFMGSSFALPDSAVAVLSFLPEDQCLAPDIAWQFDDNTPSSPLEDHVQGAIFQFGNGKVAVFGEAAMFTAQNVTQNGHTYKIGFNSPFAPQNAPFVRNVLAWLAQ